MKCIATLILVLLPACFLANAQSAVAETVVDFEELSDFDATLPAPFGMQVLGAGDVFNGYAQDAPSGGFRSNGVVFGTQEFGPGFSYSRFDNVSVPGFTNPFAAWTRGGSDGSGSGGAVIGSNYGMVFTGSSTLADGTPTNGATLNFDSRVNLTSIDITNSTYAVQYFLNGSDGFGLEPDPLHQFGDGDFFQLQITGFSGIDGSGAQTGQQLVNLADFSGPVFNEEDFISDWAVTDLSGFESTRSLRFATTSSQIGAFGSDVPAYAAIDNLRFVTAVPEPGSLVVLSSLAAVGVLRRKRRR